MDALDRIAPHARDLLDRVDSTLAAAGAPAEHPIWPLLRRVGALPSDAAGVIAGLAPAPLRTSAARLREMADAYARPRPRIDRQEDWTGPAADVFMAHWRDLSAFLGAPGEGLAGRVSITAAYYDEVADWMANSRQEMAEALATVLGSAEAVRLAGAGPTGLDPTAVRSPHAEVTAAAATIGARVLRVAADAVDAGNAVRDGWAARLGETHYRPSAGVGASSAGGTTTVHL